MRLFYVMVLLGATICCNNYSFPIEASKNGHPINAMCVPPCNVHQGCTCRYKENGQYKYIRYRQILDTLFILDLEHENAVIVMPPVNSRYAYPFSVTDNTGWKTTYYCMAKSCSKSICLCMHRNKADTMYAFKLLFDYRGKWLTMPAGPKTIKADRKRFREKYGLLALEPEL